MPLSCPFGRLSSDTVCHYLPLFGIAFRPGSGTICHYPVLGRLCSDTICHCLGLPSDLGATHLPLSCPFGRLCSDTICHYLPLFGIAFRPGSDTICHYPVLLGGSDTICHYFPLFGIAFRPGSGTICHYPVLLGGCVATLFATVWDCLPTWERHYLPLSCPFGRLSSDTICHYLPLFGIAFRPGSDTICHYPVLLGGCVATLFATICHCLGLPSDLGATLFDTILSFWGCVATLFATLGQPAMAILIFESNLVVWGARGGSCHSVSPAAREHEKRVGTCRPMSLAAVQTRLTQIGFYRRLYRHVRERRERSCCKKCCSCSRRWLS